MKELLEYHNKTAFLPIIREEVNCSMAQYNRLMRVIEGWAKDHGIDTADRKVRGGIEIMLADLIKG